MAKILSLHNGREKIVRGKIGGHLLHHAIPKDSRDCIRTRVQEEYAQQEIAAAYSGDFDATDRIRFGTGATYTYAPRIRSRGRHNVATQQLQRQPLITCIDDVLAGADNIRQFGSHGVVLESDGRGERRSRRRQYNGEQEGGLDIAMCKGADGKIAFACML